MAARPCRPGNMAAVTNKESHMPLSSFMFKYKHRLWCISGRYFQLSNVNLYLLTFTARLMPHCFSYLKRRFRGRGGGGSQQFSSNFHVGVWDSAVAPENTGTELCKAFFFLFFLTKQLCKYKQDSRLSPCCCLRNRPVGSNGKLGFQIFNRIKHTFLFCSACCALFYNVRFSITVNKGSSTLKMSMWNQISLMKHGVYWYLFLSIASATLNVFKNWTLCSTPSLFSNIDNLPCMYEVWGGRV